MTQTERDEITAELVDAWYEILAINSYARENGGKAHRRLWTALDALVAEAEAETRRG